MLCKDEGAQLKVIWDGERLGLYQFLPEIETIWNIETVILGIYMGLSFILNCILRKHKGHASKIKTAHLNKSTTFGLIIAYRYMFDICVSLEN